MSIIYAESALVEVVDVASLVHCGIDDGHINVRA